MSVRVIQGDSRELVPTLEADSVDGVVTDPPYALESIRKRYGGGQKSPVNAKQYDRLRGGFMGQQWDTGETAFDPVFWSEVLRVMKPGAHLVAFGGTRTYHRLACAIEDAGFEIRDQTTNLVANDAAIRRFCDTLTEPQVEAFVRAIDESRFGGMLSWIFGSGFPKNHNAERAIAVVTCTMPGRHFKTSLPTAEKRRPDDHICPMTRESEPWDGFGSALKPANEPIVLARKPFSGTIAANVLEHGTGAINIEGCRVSTTDDLNGGSYSDSSREDDRFFRGKKPGGGGNFRQPAGRWPSNVLHDGSEEVLEAFGRFGKSKSGQPSVERGKGGIWSPSTGKPAGPQHGDTGTAARFFYSAKADAADRLGSKHPTVKPVDLMAYLCRLITPPGGTVLDPFAGSGTTGMACMREGFDCILIEREAQFVADINKRLKHVSGEDSPLFQAAEASP